MPTPLRNQDEAFANDAFEAILAATSRPGQKLTLPQPGLNSIIAAFIDRECTVFATSEILRAQLQETGARSVNVENADFVFCSAAEVGDLMPRVKLGSELYPDEGATLIVCIKLDEHSNIQLTGPGIETSTNIGVSNLDQGFWEKRSRQIRYPTGFEMLIVDEAALVAVPRSTHVEVL